MKKVIVFIVVFIINLIVAQDNKTFTSAISKLKDDKKSFEQFTQLGQIHCKEFRSLRKSDLFTDKYLALFNSLYPFPRLIDESILKKTYIAFENKNIKSKCSDIYSTKNKEIKTIYIKIVKDKKSYHNNEEYYLEEDMKDYLKNYMMNPNRFK
ncbi:hypothetical protein [Chryseobacterium sp. JK1]|uniref:hypothetical protein n=1 Tax=Chryseobacterium sp. JK1 TaxID=874294 RepID=UPI003D68EBD0